MQANTSKYKHIPSTYGQLLANISKHQHILASITECQQILAHTSEY